jgi:hypothetical protein
VAGAGISAVFSEAANWVASGAVWLIAQVGRVMSGTTSVDLQSGWFRAHESVMATLGAAVVLPMACCAAIQAVYRQSASMLARTFLVHLPLSLLFTGVAVTLVRVALAVTDAMSATVLSSAGVDTTNLLTGLFTILVPSAAVGGPVPGFVVFLGGLFVAFAALVLWLELVVRAAAVSVAVLFLPLALAALVWPTVGHWCRRLAETLVALVLSKLVVAAVLSLAAGAVAGGLGASGSGNGGGFASVVTGMALLLIAVLAPFTLLRLIPAVEAGAVAHLESTRHRLKNAAGSAREGGNLALDLVKNFGSPPEELGTGSVGTGSVGTGSVGTVVGAAATGGTGAAAGAATGAGAKTGSGTGDGDGEGDGGGRSPAIRMLTGTDVALTSHPMEAPGDEVPSERSGEESSPARTRDRGTGRGDE